MEKRGLAILGSTGSIGTQALEVFEAHSDKFELVVLTANSNAALLIEQAKKYLPNTVVIADENRFEEVKNALWEDDIKVFAGKEALSQVVQMDEIEIVLTALVGFAGLEPTMSAIEAGKNIALANKETLVVAGELVTQRAQEKGVNIYPVDSEHSAIFQCIVGEFHNKIEKIYLTASGGPFRGKTTEDLKSVTKAQALNHPNWDMGAKITIDSASLMNKGLEVIEAKWLFGLKPEQIDVIVHPQSILHSLVQFEDGSIKSQMGLPDMKLPIQFALSYPDRFKSDFPRFNFADFPNLTFEQPDKDTFKNLQLAFDAMGASNGMPCVLNAANEVTVQAFLEEKIQFLDIANYNEKAMIHFSGSSASSIQELIALDDSVRSYVDSLI